MNFWALIPARGGSKGIPRKNIRNVNGLPLIAYSIKSALKTNIFEEVFVSTDSEEISNTAIKFNAKVPFLRNKTDATDNAHMFGVYRNFLLGMKEKGYKLPDILCVLLPTNPLRTEKDIIDVLSSYEKNKLIDWSFSCNEMEHHPYRSVRLSSNGILQPFFPLSNDVMWSNRQELPKAYRFNGAIISGKVNSILDNSEYPIDSFNFMDTNVMGIVTSKYCGVDIDTITDLEYVEFLMRRNNER